jgi:RNA polymerase sigma factor (sigma-70 family)
MQNAGLVAPEESSRSEGTNFWSTRPDQELLRLFVEEHNGAAFAAIVHRHGPMVLGVCRRVLHSMQDAEDAFQTSFLVLVAKASSMREPRLLSSWLHGVALRTAQHLRVRDARRSRRELEAAYVSIVGSRESTSRWGELRQRLDAEMQALPKKYRAPLVLCYLEGKTHEEAARSLGWPSGSMSARVARGRELLRRRLAGCDREMHACVFPFLFVCSIEQAPVPSQLANYTVAAALGAYTASAISEANVGPDMQPVSRVSLRDSEHARVAQRLRLFLAVVAVLLGFSAVAYAIAGPTFFGPHKLPGSISGESQTAPLSPCHRL